MSLLFASALLFLTQGQGAMPEAECAAPVAQTAMNIRAYRDYEQADRALNEAWRAAAARSKEGIANSPDTAAFERLLAAQRHWLMFRDAHCLAQTGPREGSGTIGPLLHHRCLAEVTQTRTAQLRAASEPGL